MNSLFKGVGIKRYPSQNQEYLSLQSISDSLDANDNHMNGVALTPKKKLVETLDKNNVINVFSSIDSNESKPLKKVSSFNKMNQLLHPPHRTQSPILSPGDKENVSPLTNQTTPRESIKFNSQPKEYRIKVNKPVDSRFFTARNASTIASSSQDSHYYPVENKYGDEKSYNRSTPPQENHATLYIAPHQKQGRGEEKKLDGETPNEKSEVEPGDDDDVEEEYITKIFSKARHNHLDYVMEQIRKGFDLQTTDEYGNTLIHICAQNNHRKLASIILKAYPQTNVSPKNLKGLTPLDYCEKYGFLKMYDWLISLGAVESLSKEHYYR